MKLPILIAAVMLAGNALAESATTSKSTELMDKASADASVIGTLANQTRVDVMQRNGAWTQVQTSAGQAGWVRMTALRLDATTGSNVVPASGGNVLGSLMTGGRTSNTGTVGTGVKGLDKEDLRRASPNYSELDKMQANIVSKDSARTFAQRSNLSSVSVAYIEQSNSNNRETN